MQIRSAQLQTTLNISTAKTLMEGEALTIDLQG
jgi:hypothetical protein